MSIIILLLGIFLFSLVLIKAADIAVGAISKLSKTLRTGAFFLSAIVLAVGTSFPELFVALTSSLGGTPNLSLGNVIGANITNISLVTSITAIVFGTIKVQGNVLKKDLGVALLAGVVPFLLIFDTVLSRVDGLILLSIYGVYASSLFRTRYMEIAEEQIEAQEDVVGKIFRQIVVVGKNNYQTIGRLFFGVTLLLVSAEAIVRMANTLSGHLNIPVFLVGLIILSLGTTLPELAFSIRSLRDHHPTMFFGNLLGSIIANSTLVIGVAAVISPIRVIAFENYTIAFITFCLSFLFFFIFARTRHTLSRAEGIILLLIYVMFVVIEFI